MSDRAPLELELNGYVDGALDDEAMAEIERYLKAQPHAAAKVRDYLQQKADIRAYAQEPAATSQSAAIDELEKQLARRLKRRPLLSWPRMAVVATLLGAGWIGHGTYVGFIEGPRYADEVIQAHILAAAVPVGVDSASIAPETVARMFSLIGERQHVPNLDAFGLRPAAAKLVPSDEGPVLHVTYRDDAGTILSYFVLHDEKHHDVPRHVLHRNGVTLIYWQHDQSRYAIAAPLADEQLERIADLVQPVEQI